MVVSNLLDSICNFATSRTDLCHKWSPDWSVGTSHPFSSCCRLHMAVQLWVYTLDDLWGRRDCWNCSCRFPSRPLAGCGTLLCKGGLSDGVWVMDGAKGSERRACILQWTSCCSSSASSERLQAGIGRCEHQARARVLQGERWKGASAMEQLW